MKRLAAALIQSQVQSQAMEMALNWSLLVGRKFRQMGPPTRLLMESQM